MSKMYHESYADVCVGSARHVLLHDTEYTCLGSYTLEVTINVLMNVLLFICDELRSNFDCFQNSDLSKIVAGEHALTALELRTSLVETI